MSTQTKASRIENNIVAELKPLRFENGKALLIAGLKERHGADKIEGIPLQWQRFSTYVGNINGEVGRKAYGVCFDSDDAGKFDYISGVEVASLAGLPVYRPAAAGPKRGAHCRLVSPGLPATAAPIDRLDNKPA